MGMRKAWLLAASAATLVAGCSGNTEDTPPDAAPATTAAATAAPAAAAPVAAAMPAGAPASDEGAPFAHGGQVWLTDLGDLNTLRVEGPQGLCRVSFALPPDQGAAATLGPLTCTP